LLNNWCSAKLIDLITYLWTLSIESILRLGVPYFKSISTRGRLLINLICVNAIYFLCNYCRDDDDINDVAAMGGVNLVEESRNILAANSELVSGQLRSCKDEIFFDSQRLLARITDIGE